MKVSGTAVISYIEMFFMVAVFVVVFARSDKVSELDIFAPFLFMFFVVVFSIEMGFISRFLLKFKYLGEISYSIYLNQITVLLTVRYVSTVIEMSTLTVLLAYIISLVVYSHFTYQYIEKPFRRKGRDILSRITKKSLRAEL